jgi:hypothetical protein
MKDFSRPQGQNQGQSGQNFMRPNPNQGSMNQSQYERKEMKGPENINTLLSGLKKVNVDNESTVSAEEIDLMNTSVPKSVRKRRSDKNTISLVI